MSVYNRVHNLHSCLQQIVSNQTLRYLTNQRLNRKRSPTGPALYDIALWKKNFLQVIEAATAKVWKYLFKQSELAKQAKVCDLRQIASLSSEITELPLIFPPQKCSEILDSVEWTLYRSSATPCSSDFDVIQWWVGMKDRLPRMYPLVRRTLCIPHNSCDVERTFLVWKQVRSDKQYNMQHETHKAHVSFCFLRHHK